MPTGYFADLTVNGKRTELVSDQESEAVMSDSSKKIAASTVKIAEAAAKMSLTLGVSFQEATKVLENLKASLSCSTDAILKEVDRQADQFEADTPDELKEKLKREAIQRRLAEDTRTRIIDLE